MLPQNIEIGFRFSIGITYQDKVYKYSIIKTWETEQVEHFMLIASNKSLLFQSDRPSLRNRGKDIGKIKWRMIHGDVDDMDMVEEIIRNMNFIVRQYEQFDPNHQDPKNNYHPDSPEKY